MEKDEELNISEEQIRSIIKEIEEKTIRNEYRIIINHDRKPELFDNKFGGLPYWDLSKEYPKDSSGENLVFLAQINLDGLERLNNSDGIELPEKGMLQFFHAANDLYGFDFDADVDCDLEKNKGYRVIYHETIDKNVTEEQIRAFGIGTFEDVESVCTPLECVSAIDVFIDKTSLHISDYRYDEMFIQILKEKFGIDVSDDCCMYDILDDDGLEIIDEIEEKESELEEPRHNMLGYASFTQFDPREGNKNLEKYDVVLFQMDSDYNYDNDENYYTGVMWGDAGIGNFFINHVDLKNKNFSDILYNWDCC